MKIPELKAKDIVAIVTVLAIVALAVLKPEETINTVFGAFLGYYFAHRKTGSDTGV